MKSIILATLASAALTAPAFAQSTTDFAIMHFNMDADTPSDIRMVPQGPIREMQLEDGTTLMQVFDQFNMDADTLADMRGGNGVTVIMGDPSNATEIFRRIMAESQEDE